MKIITDNFKIMKDLDYYTVIVRGLHDKSRINKQVNFDSLHKSFPHRVIKVKVMGWQLNN